MIRLPGDREDSNTTHVRPLPVFEMTLTVAKSARAVTSNSPGVLEVCSYHAKKANKEVWLSPATLIPGIKYISIGHQSHVIAAILSIVMATGSSATNKPLLYGSVLQNHRTLLITSAFWFNLSALLKSYRLMLVVTFYYIYTVHLPQEKQKTKQNKNNKTKNISHLPSYLSGVEVCCVKF